MALCEGAKKGMETVVSKHLAEKFTTLAVFE